MTDLLTPDGARELLEELKGLAYLDKLATDLEHLCRDYLTLWDRNKELEERVSFAEAFLPKGHLHD